jgi:hypothetical protein
VGVEALPPPSEVLLLGDDVLVVEEPSVPALRESVL